MDSVIGIQEQCLSDSERWFPDVAHDLIHHALSMAGEVGEFCNLLKKIERGSLRHDNESHLELAMELTDVFIYLMNIAAVMNIDIGEAYDYKRKVNIDRFGSANPHPTPGRISGPLQSTDGEGPG